MDPKYAFAYNNRAAAMFKLDKFQECLDDCTKAISIDPNYGYAYLNRGNAKEMLRDDKGACEDWNKSIELGAKGGEQHIGGCK